MYTYQCYLNASWMFTRHFQKYLLSELTIYCCNICLSSVYQYFSKALQNVWMLKFWHKQILNASISHFCPVVCPFALQATCPAVYDISYYMTLSSIRIAAKRHLCLGFLKYNFSVITVYECVEYLTFPDPWLAVETLSLRLIIHTYYWACWPTELRIAKWF